MEASIVAAAVADAAETRIPVLVAESPLDCVVDGTGICLEHPLDK